MDKETSRTIIWVVAIIAAAIVLVSLRNAMGPIANNPGKGADAIQPNVVNNPAPAPIANVDAAKLVDDDPAMSQGNPKVTIVEFSDFQCPFCKRFHDDAYKQIVDQYVKTGKAKFVYRDFPLDIRTHPQAAPAAEASECADDQGKFWEFHDKLFANQGMLSVENYKKWAADLGMDTKKFNDCVDSRKHQQEVQKDFSDGQAAGVSGTPTVFVNSRKIIGARSFSVFQSEIEAELNS